MCIRDSPLVVHLATRIEQAPDDALIDASIQQMLDNLLLLEGSFSGSVADLVAGIIQKYGVIDLSLIHI